MSTPQCTVLPSFQSGKSSRNLKYKDFFDPVESDEDGTGLPDEDLGSEEEEGGTAERGGEDSLSDT